QEWKRSTRANRPFSLVLMDLDRFKFVNDFYGHLEGDVVLQRVGHILEQNCRRSDVVARYGGDEFVILMPETSVEQARQLASAPASGADGLLPAPRCAQKTSMQASASPAFRCMAPRHKNSSRWRTLRCTSPSIKEAIPSRPRSKPTPTIQSAGKKTCWRRISA